MKGFLFFVFIYCYSVPLYAAESDFYFGGGVGLAHMNVLESDIKTGLNFIEGGRVKTSEANNYYNEDSYSLAYRVFTGYSLNPYMSFELKLYDLGEIDVTKVTHKEFADGSSSTVHNSLKLSAQGLSLSTLMSYPIDETTSLYVSLGGAWTKQKQKHKNQILQFELVNNVVIPTTGYVFSEVKNDYFGFIYGVGASYKISESFDTRLELNGIELNGGRIFEGNLSLIYRL